MTKGYQGEKGTISGKPDSPFEFYVVDLDCGIRIVVGPTAFVTEEGRGT